jgi:hypothetical protein
VLVPGNYGSFAQPEKRYGEALGMHYLAGYQRIQLLDRHIVPAVQLHRGPVYHEGYS